MLSAIKGVVSILWTAFALFFVLVFIVLPCYVSYPIAAWQQWNNPDFWEIPFPYNPRQNLSFIVVVTLAYIYILMEFGKRKKKEKKVSLFGLLSDLVQGAAHAVKNRTHPAIAQCCTVLGWDINEKKGEDVVLYFKDPVLGRREVSVLISEGGVFMIFLAMSQAMLSARNVPSNVMGYALLKNHQLGMLAWGARVADGEVNFAISAALPIKGIDPDMFKHLALAAANEAHEFDQMLRQERLL